MAGFRFNREFGLLAALVAMVLVAPSPASANTITVNSSADPGSGGICTLHDAILAANGNSTVNGCVAGGGASDVIDATALAGQTIMLAGALPTVTSSVDINGPGSGQLTVTGQDLVRPLNLNSAAVVNITGLTITHGFCGNACGGTGGGINNAGTLTLTDVVVSQNHADRSGGTDNFAEGGGIVNLGGATLHLVLSTVTGNSVTASGGSSQNNSTGAGIQSGNTAVLTLDRSTVSSNSASATGTATGTTSASGGGIVINGPLTISRSTIEGNTVSASGSSVANTTQGGGISAFNAPAVTISLDRTTITGNSVTAGGTGASASRGGVNAAGSTFSITSSTISGNSAPLYANLAVGSTMKTIKNTIVSNPLGGGVNCNGTGTASLGFNIDSGTTCGFAQAGDHQSTDPMLDSSLADNGGPTRTLALLTGSPAIDAGLSSVGEMADQRGLTRPLDLSAISNAAGSDGTDIGAFEVQGPAVPPPTGGGGSPPVAPDTSLSARIRKAKHKATFTFRSADPSATFMCKLDKRAFAPCTSPATFKHLRIGRHTFLVEAVSAAGPDPTPATFSFKLKR
jgi:hypothetical protein